MARHIKQSRPVLIHFLVLLQFIGFSGSLGPSQSTRMILSLPKWSSSGCTVSFLRVPFLPARPAKDERREAEVGASAAPELVGDSVSTSPVAYCSSPGKKVRAMLVCFFATIFGALELQVGAKKEITFRQGEIYMVTSSRRSALLDRSSEEQAKHQRPSDGTKFGRRPQAATIGVSRVDDEQNHSKIFWRWRRHTKIRQKEARHKLTSPTCHVARRRGWTERTRGRRPRARKRQRNGLTRRIVVRPGCGHQQQASVHQSEDALSSGHGVRSPI